MFDARTDHKIEAFGSNIMKLKEFDADVTIIEATRPAENEPWEIHTDADGVPDATATTRGEAIQTMVNMALAALPGDGYSCIIPHGLPEMP